MKTIPSIPEMLAAIWAWITGKESELTAALAKVVNLTAEKTALDAKVKELEGPAGQATAELTTTKEKLTQVEKDLAAANEAISKHGTAITAKDGEIQKLQESQAAFEKATGKKAAEMLAASGISTGKLPQTTENAAGTIDQQITALRSKLDTATPAERWTINQEIKELLKQRAKA